jgi:hypothetical protein
MAANEVVVNDAIVGELLKLLRDATRSPKLRGAAAISLGPALELADEDDEVLEELDEPPVSPLTVESMKQALRREYEATANPVEVRRRALEAAVRMPAEWHADAVRAAYASADPTWKLTAVFCMQYVQGFEKEILAALQGGDPAIQREAAVAAGQWSMDAAWPVLASLATPRTPKELLLAVIDALPEIRPEEAPELLEPLTESRDDEIASAAEEAIDLCGSITEFDEDEETDEPAR